MRILPQRLNIGETIQHYLWGGGEVFQQTQQIHSLLQGGYGAQIMPNLSRKCSQSRGLDHYGDTE